MNSNILVKFHFLFLFGSGFCGKYCRQLEECIETITPNCPCGKTFSPKIVGGQMALPHEFPWQVGLGVKGHGPFCGGTLVSDFHIVTAAHCFEGITEILDKYRILLGMDNYERLTTASTQRKIKVLRIHPNYSKHEFLNDIAVVRVDRRIPFTAAISPICFPPPGRSYVGMYATVIGWGRISEKGWPSPDLLKVKVPIREADVCHLILGKTEPVPTHVCAFYNSGKKDACEGDSGSPMMIYNNSRWYFVGLVSFGSGCAEPFTPAIYTRISYYYKWIDFWTKGGHFCTA